VTIEDVIKALAREPLRHIVLLKQLLAYPEHVKAHRVSGAAGEATLVALEASVSVYDRQAYPETALIAFIASDHPDLTSSLLPHVPRGVGIVFKLASEADLAPVQAHFRITRRTAFVSFTSAGAMEPDASVRVASAPGDTAFRLFAEQSHDRAWLEPLLHGDKAFACVLERDGEALSACFVFENYGPVWEVGGVVTASAHRRKGLGVCVVRTALAELARRGLAPRYQVEEHNTASVALARSVGLAPFVTITHSCTTSKRARRPKRKRRTRRSAAAMVGVRGFEPPAPSSRISRSYPKCMVYKGFRPLGWASLTSFGPLSP
jgi:GNAT superfamily N-acetyltransferase